MMNLEWRRWFRSRSEPPIRVAVDLFRLEAGGRNGGIKPFVFDFLKWIGRERAGEFVFVHLTRTSLVPEVEAFRRDQDWQICVGESEGHPPPATGGRPGLVWAPDAMAGDWLGRWPVDVLYAPLGLSPFRRPGLPWICLIADLLHRDRPEMLSANENAYRDRWMAEGLAEADAVQCISDFTRRQLIRHFGARPGRLFVTHYAISGIRAPGDRRVPARPPAGRPYFFYPANDWPHKNHDALFEGYASYRNQAGAGAWDLVLSGHRTRTEAWKERMASLGIAPACRMLGHIGPGEFPAVFRGAGALVFPSLYEGFGMPVLEAMAWGVPIACSRAGSLPEVAGKAALYFDPERPEAITRALGEIAGNARTRGKLVAAGLRRARAFSMAREAGRLADNFAALRRVAARGTGQ
jgi:glycosyltransferase involved in cell wall biosynthesis